MKKRGISAVVATILIILIVVVGVGIVWKVILPLFSELEYLSYSDVRLSIVFQGYTVYDADKHFAFVQVERGKDDVNITKLEIGFSFDGTTKTYQTTAVPEPGGKYTYKFNFTNDSDKGIPQNVTPSKVTVAPVFIIKNQVRLGKILDTEDMPVGNIHLSEEAWKEANDEATHIVVIHSGTGEEPGEEVEPVEPTCTFTSEEVCGNDVDEDCANGAEDGCDVLGYFFEGSGVEGDSYVIENCYQLQNMSYDLSADYELKKDIDCSMTRDWNNGKGFDPVGNKYLESFIGDFDGKGKEIIGLFISRGDENYVGLFGDISFGNVGDVGMIDSNITGSNYVGGIIGDSYYSPITNSYNTGSVTGSNYVGGIIGYYYYSSINDSYNAGIVKGVSQVGGITGKSYYHSSITDSYNIGSIIGSSRVGGIAGYIDYYSSITMSYNLGSISGSVDMGGIAGYGHLSSITDSYNTGNVTGSSRVGGITGYIDYYSSITDSYNTGTISGFITGSTYYVGGITGMSFRSSITDSYNTGAITSPLPGSLNYVGGIVGKLAYSTMVNSYNIGSIIGSSRVGGIIGSLGTSTVSNSYYLNTSCIVVTCDDNGPSLTENQMRIMGSYSEWNDAGDIWEIGSDCSYPYLIGNEQIPHPGI